MANENQIKHKIVISGEQEYKRAMREMSSQLKEAKSEVKATAAEMDAQGKTVDSLTAQMRALETQRQKEADMLREMQRHLEAVTEATGAESDEAVRLRTRINAMRAEVAQTTTQMSRLTGELDEAREAAEGLGGSGAADGIRSLGNAADAAEGDLDGILGKLGSIGQGFTIGIGVSLGEKAFEMVSGAISDAIKAGWEDAVNNKIEYNQLGIKTGTAGTGQNLYMQQLLGNLKIQNPNRDAGEWISAIAEAYTQFTPDTFKDADRLNNILARLDAVSFGVGTDLPGVINTIGRLKDVFGENEEDLGDILYWLGTSKAGNEGINVLESYATSWQSIGMNAIGAAGALVLARIAGVDNLTAVGKAANEAQEFILKNQEGLKQLGIEAADLPNKFREGGDEAKKAMQLVLRSFLDADPETQNKLGPQIFGQQGWERYGTRIAEAILGGYETTLTDEMKESTKRAVEAQTDDIPSRVGQIGEIITQELGKQFETPLDIILGGLTGSVEEATQAREEGKNVFLALARGFVDGIGEAWEEKGLWMPPDASYTFDADDIMASWKAGEDSLGAANEKGHNFFTDLWTAFWGGVEEESQAVETPEIPFLETYEQGTADLEDKINEALENDDPVLAAEFMANQQTLDLMAQQAEEYARIAGTEAGENAASAAAEAYAEGFARNPRMREVENFEISIQEAGEETADAVMDAYASGLARNPRMRGQDALELPPVSAAPASAVDDFLDAVLGTGESDALAAAAEEAGKEDAQTALEAYAEGVTTGTDYQSIKAQVENLNAQIAAAFGAGDEDLARELSAKRDALIPTLMLLAADARSAGNDAKSGFDDSFKGIEVTVEDTATGAVEKWESGISGLPMAGQNSIDGLMNVLNGAADPAYTAGWNAGNAFTRGYNDAQGIHSPSEVMAEAAGYSIAGLLQGIDRGSIDLEARAAGLSDLLAGSVKNAGSAIGTPTISGSGGIDAAELREILSDIVLAIDGEVAGGLVEKSVSRTSAQRAAGTIAGRATRLRSL